MRSMGSMTELLGMIPGVNKAALPDAATSEKALSKTEAIILSMTPEERDNPSILSPSRKRRVALGCGMKVEDVNRLLKQFEASRKMMKQMTGGNMKKLKRKKGFGGMRLPF